MPDFVKRLSTYWEQVKSSTQAFFDNSWPINWSNFNKFSLLSESVVHAPYGLKIMLYGSIAATLISFSFFSFQVYILATVQVPEQGGVFHEALVASDLQRLNPVLASTSEAEQKLNSLLYHPLYELDYPNFVESDQTLPTIKPVLITQEPEWVDDPETTDDDYRILRFELREGLKWSDDTDITIDDLIYSFNRIRADGGNSNFRSLFAGYELVGSSDNPREFFIRAASPTTKPNPYLKYLVNFSPISEEFYEGRDNTELATALKSVKPTVTSGMFTFTNKVIDPLNPRGGEVDNPIDDENGGIARYVLTRNPVQNLDQEVYIDTYVLHFQDSVDGVSNSLQSLSQENNLDLYQRFLSSSSQITSAEVKESLELSQAVVPSNTYFNLFLNIRGSGGGFRGYFINQALRKYIVCKFYDHEFGLDDQYVRATPKSNRILPIQLNQEFDLDCQNIDQELTSATSSGGQSIYGINSDEVSNIKRVTLFGNEFGTAPNKLSLVGLQDFQGLGRQVQTRLLDIGLPVDAQWLSAADLEQKIAAKDYHFLFLPVTLVNDNLYPLYGNGARNVSGITGNERVNGTSVEGDLLAMSQNPEVDVEVRQRVINFFAGEYVSLNLFQGLQEINYSARIASLKDSIPSSLNFADQIYTSTPAWFTERKRVPFWTEEAKNRPQLTS